MSTAHQKTEPDWFTAPAPQGMSPRRVGEGIKKVQRSAVRLQTDCAGGMPHVPNLPMGLNTEDAILVICICLVEARLPSGQQTDDQLLEGVYRVLSSQET